LERRKRNRIQQKRVIIELHRGGIGLGGLRTEARKRVFEVCAFVVRGSFPKGDTMRCLFGCLGVGRDRKRGAYSGREHHWERAGERRKAGSTCRGGVCVGQEGYLSLGRASWGL